MKFSVVIFMLLAAVCSACPPYKVIRIKECKGTFETKGTSASDSDKDMKCLSHPPVHFKPICTHKLPVGFKPLPADFKPPAACLIHLTKPAGTPPLLEGWSIGLRNVR